MSTSLQLRDTSSQFCRGIMTKCGQTTWRSRFSHLADRHAGLHFNPSAEKTNTNCRDFEIRGERGPDIGSDQNLVLPVTPFRPRELSRGRHRAGWRETFPARSFSPFLCLPPPRFYPFIHKPGGSYRRGLNIIDVSSLNCSLR